MARTKDINAIVTKRGGTQLSDHNHYKAVFSSIPTLTEIVDMQQDLGFHPAGYGTPFDIEIKQQGQHFHTTWKSWGCCD